MKRARNPWPPLFRTLSLLALGGVWAVACGGPQEPGAAGSVCFRSDDCKDGLACVPTAKGSTKSVCSADLGAIVSMVDGAPPDSGPPVADASGGAAGAMPSGGAAGKAGATGGGGGKPATGGASGMSGSGTAGKSSAGGPAGGAPTGGAPSGGSGTAGTGTAGTGTAGSSVGGGGTGGSGPVDAGDG